MTTNDQSSGRYFVYILTNATHRSIYVGVTNNLHRRVYEHKNELIPGFTQKYKLKWLVHFEETSDVESAIEREKAIKGWLRSRKVALIESTNPRWVDLAQDWYGDVQSGL